MLPVQVEKVLTIVSQRKEDFVIWDAKDVYKRQDADIPLEAKLKEYIDNKSTAGSRRFYY